MISQTMQNALNEQAKNELYSSYIYLAMAAYFHDQNWEGMAGWMHKQAAEEKEHFEKFFNYIIERGGRVELKALEKPPFEWDSPLAVFKAAYKHEQFITAKINELYELAKEEGDHATEVMLHWFIEEQVEEESSVEEIVVMLEKIGDAMPPMFMLDSKLGGR